MKILVISPFLPWPPYDGARIRILETLRYLSSEHDITLAANVGPDEDPANVDALREYCEDVVVEVLPDSALARMWRMLAGLMKGSSFVQSIHYNGKLSRRIKALTTETDFDIIQIELSFMARYAASINPACKAARVLATHNIETQRFRREMRLSSWNARRAVLSLESLIFPDWESKSLEHFDGFIAVSVADADWIRGQVAAKPVELVPNGVDTEFFRPERDVDASTSQSIAFTGLMDYPPNTDAVCWFADEIFPSLKEAYPDLQFKIVGARPNEQVNALRARPGITVTGEVPDIRPFVHTATAFVVPLRSGGGTRLKILQAMALGCPVISTAVGAEGLDVEEDRDILYAETSDQFVRQVGKLISSSETADKLGTQGRKLVTTAYDWNSCLKGADALYSRLTGKVA